MTAPVRPIPRLAGIVAAALEGGASDVQFREKVAASDRLAAAQAVGDVCRARRVPFLVNDDPNLAREFHADGVHVGRGDTQPGDARGILGPDRILGVTVYGKAGEERAAQAAGADYLAVGPFFPSPTKPDEPVLSLAVLDDVISRSRLPVFAIGGITAKRAGEIARHGATGVAVISAIMESLDPKRSAREILGAFEAGLSGR